MPPKRSDRDRRIRQAYRHARMMRVLELIQGKARWGIKPMLCTGAKLVFYVIDGAAICFAAQRLFTADDPEGGIVLVADKSWP